MLETYLSSLTKRQSMLLLTAVTFGGQEALSSLEFLADDEAALLRHRAEALLAFPRERRIPLLVQEMKRLVTPRRGQLWATGPEQLAQLMLRERAVLRQVLLKALPSGLADSVRRCLPPERSKPGREVRPEVLAILRGRLEDILARATPVGTAFKFADVLLLQPRELVTLLDELGIRALAPALAGLKEELRAPFLSELPPGHLERINEAVTASTPRRLLPEDAEEILALHPGTGLGPIRSAGSLKLARALLAQSPEFALRVLERNPGEQGQLLARWLKEERSRAVNRGDGGRSDVVSVMENLATKGLVERPLRPRTPVAAATPPPVGTGPGPRPPLLPAPRAQAAVRMATSALASKEPNTEPPTRSHGPGRSGRQTVSPPGRGPKRGR
jgi:hypothetical protein